MKKFRIAVFASGNGSNAEAIFVHFKDHAQAEVTMLLSNNPNSLALVRAGKFGIPTRTFTGKQFRETDEVLDWLKAASITHVVLAGFMLLVPQNLLKAYSNRIINIHPSLLPKYGGKGMFGMNVHKAVKSANERATGITIHVVNDQYDEGKIIFQESCLLSYSDTAEGIAERVQRLEHAHYPRVIESWLE